MATRHLNHVQESRFGVWFLSTKIWETRVLDIAINSLAGLISERKPSYPVILDVGCGMGRSFLRLWQQFSPQLIVGADIDAKMLDIAATEADSLPVDVTLVRGDSAHLALDDGSVDLLFCHQTFHHLVDQDAAIREFNRVLKPGGLLLFAESTRCFIYSWTIRYLFRHPMEVQKSADEYLRLIANAGFRVQRDSIAYPYLWWSRPDLGIGENWFGKPPPSQREETLINLVAVKGA